ncbi:MULTISPECIES: hypothetical protein [Flavobacterium]|uniref:hypothetical protein n=1 Tax=Flavobacterium TaxID=237 RepID=UPI001182CA8E|nr:MULTISPECIES: hypothetical protein [Flavobacterium]MCR4029797.1 hypothetical protein [Flavobacterium panacis]
MDKITFTRSELYTLVWKFPLVQIAKHYEISTMGIKNACSKLEIPLPKNKHWTGPEYKRINIPKLAFNYKGNNEISIFKKRYEMHFRIASKPTPLQELAVKIKNDENAPLQVPKKLKNPFPIVTATEKLWISKVLNDGIYEAKSNVLDLNVSIDSINRALLFMNAFIKLIEYRGHKFGKSEHGLDTVFFSNGIEIKVDLREALKRITANGLRETTEYVFTGDFIFRIAKESDKKEWRDGRIMLEDNLALIVAKLELMALEE